MQKAVPALQRYVACAIAVGGLIFICFRLVPENATTVSLLMLLLVLGAATRWGLPEAIFTSLVSVLGLNYYFLPPVGQFTIADPENWVALFVFLVTAVSASELSAQAKRRAEEAMTGRDEIGRLYELSRAMLMDEARDAVRVSVTKTGQILRLRHIAFYDAAANRIYGAIDDSGITMADLVRVAETGQRSGSGELSIIPVRLGAHLVGSLALHGARISTAVQDSVASLLAINYERARALDRAAAAEVARRSEEFKSSLLDGLAHDLKTPLTAIRTCVTHLITEPPRTEGVRQELLNIIDQESVRLQQSITEAVELARVESGQLRLNREPADIAAMASAAVAEIRDENSSRYSIHVPPGLLIPADAELLRRALMQILENARKYAPPESPIAIEAQADGDQAIISVSDRGPGISPDELEHIFEKFYRGHRARGKVEGTGMGLAIAKGIIEAHGGNIHAENRPGGGAVISFSLPLQPKTL
jgi:two-component system sensor histidine kinase KdpD